MYKAKVQLEVKRGDKAYSLYCEPDSQLGEIYDVLSEMSRYVVSKINELQKASEPKQEAAPEAEAPKD